MKASRIIKFAFISIISIILLLSAYVALNSSEASISLFQKLHLLTYKNALGLIDIIIALALWSKKTRDIGILIGSAYLGGAIASELSSGGTAVMPAILLLMLWIIHKIDLRKKCSCGVCDTCVVKVASPQR
jgi:hypothetical protein